MKFFRPVFFAAAIAVIPVLLLSTAKAEDGKAQSARGALKALAQQKGAHYLGRVLMVEGRYGYHQPKAWRVVTLDPQIQGRLREFMINGDQIDSERVMLGWNQGRRVPLREVAVDSSDAFLQADLAAKDAKIGFDSLNYQLIMPSEGKEPLWLVTLVGTTGDAVGEVQVGAKTGMVIRKAWPKPGVPLAKRPKEQRVPAKRITPKKPQAAPVKAVGNQARRSDRVSRPPKPQNVALARKPAPPPQVRLRPAQRQTQPVATADIATIKEASGQILEGARRGIIRTTGNVRDFFKALQEK